MKKKIFLISILLITTSFLFAKQYVYEGKAMNVEKAKNEKVKELIDEGYNIVQATTSGFTFTIIYEDTVKKSIKNVTESEEFKQGVETAKEIGGKIWNKTKEFGSKALTKGAELLDEYNEKKQTEENNSSEPDTEI